MMERNALRTHQASTCSEHPQLGIQSNFGYFARTKALHDSMSHRTLSSNSPPPKSAHNDHKL